MNNDNWVDIFVYGNFQPNKSRSDILSLPGTKGSTEYRMFSSTAPKYDLLDFGGFPGLVYGNYSIGGEIYSLSPEALKIVDEYEECPYLFYRDNIEMLDGDIIQAYFFNYDERGKLLLNAFRKDIMSVESKVTFLRDGLKIWTGN